MTDGWVVLDTAIKVGLGAVISGLTTYIVLGRTHDNDLLKAAINDASALLKEGALKLEKSSSALNGAIHEYDCVVARGGRRSDLKEASALALSAYNEGKDAKALFFLIGAPELADLVMPYLNATESIREEVGDESKAQELAPDALGKHAKKARDARHIILHSLGKTYEAIRSRK